MGKNDGLERHSIHLHPDRIEDMQVINLAKTKAGEKGFNTMRSAVDAALVETASRYRKKLFGSKIAGARMSRNASGDVGNAGQ